MDIKSTIDHGKIKTKIAKLMTSLICLENEINRLPDTAELQSLFKAHGEVQDAVEFLMGEYMDFIQDNLAKLYQLFSTIGFEDDGDDEEDFED